MRRPRNSHGKSNPIRNLIAERNRASGIVRARDRGQIMKEDLPALIDERVGDQIDKLETRLVDGFREMGQRVVEQSTDVLTSQLGGRLDQLEHISVIQTDTINKLKDSSKLTEQRMSGVVNSIEKALGDAVPGFRLEPPSHLPPQLNPPQQHEPRELITQDQAFADGKLPDVYCPRCTSVNVRRANRSGMWDELLRLFFVAPFRCRACRHKFYRF